MREASEKAVEQFEIEKHNLMARNKKLENEVQNLKSLLSFDGDSSSRPRMFSGLSDAVTGAIRRNTATNDEDAVPVGTTSLEKTMEKVMIYLPSECITQFVKLQKHQFHRLWVSSVFSILSKQNYFPAWKEINCKKL